MSESLLCILLVTSSAKGSSLVYRWPPSPSPTPRLARPLPAEDFPGAFADNPWRAAHSHENTGDETQPGAFADLKVRDDSDYIWHRPPVFQTRNRSLSLSQPHSHSRSTSRRASPSKLSVPDMSNSFDAEHARGSALASDDDDYDTILGYNAEFLAQQLCPQSSMCHQKFELVVDDLAFIGHPVCADSEGVWEFKPEKVRFTTRGRGSRKGQSPQMEEKSMTPERYKRAAPDDSWLQTFHLVLVLDVPDPSSSASGNISRYYDIVYEQIAFSITAVLYQEQIQSNYVEDQCDHLIGLREKFVGKGETFMSFMDAALHTSSLAPAMKTLYEAIKDNSIAHLTINDLPIEVQLPPHLDSLLHVEDEADADIEERDDDDAAPNAWGREMSFAWRLPALSPWKALLRLDEDDGEYALSMQLRAPQLGPDDRELAEQVLRFVKDSTVTLSLAETASLLDWDLETQVYPIVRWLINHRRAKLVDVVHPGLKTVFTIPQKYPAPLATLSAEFARAFAYAPSVAPLPKLLAMLSSTATPSAAAAAAEGGTTAKNHFYATIVRARELIPLYTDVILWMLRRDLLVRLHLRIRIVAPEELKKRVRQRWEDVRARRSKERARGSRERSSDRGAPRERGRRRDKDVGEDDMAPALETVTESSPVEYWVSLSPKTARRRARQLSADGRDADVGAAGSYGAGTPASFGQDGMPGTLDEEMLGSSSADEAHWEEYYQSGGNDNIASMISDPARAKPLERLWLAGMSEGKDPDIARRFEQIHQYFDGKCSDDEILFRADISRRMLREVLHHYEEYLQTFLHPS